MVQPGACTINDHAIGTNGTPAATICNGPGFFRVDAALTKNFKLGKGVNLQFRAEMFNVFNRANFLSDDGNVSDQLDSAATSSSTPGNGATATRIMSATPRGGFGQLNRAADPRQVQLGLRLSF